MCGDHHHAATIIIDRAMMDFFALLAVVIFPGDAAVLAGGAQFNIWDLAL